MYLIVGAGRTARHFKHYFNLLQIPYLHWNRQEHTEQQLISLFDQCDRALLLIKDSAIEEFYKSHFSNLIKPVIHFSGALHVPGIHALHPLMTFGPELRDQKFYEDIGFVSFSDDRFENLLPGLKNPSVKVSAELQGLYHAQCVLSGNVTTLLWQEFFRFLSENKIPQSFGKAYLEEIIRNALQSSALALTGPLARKDQKTISKNLESLKSTPLEKIYLGAQELSEQLAGEKS
ncbi:MAG: DUF2520 domain-containing protein [Pseudobdellovibrionaceae bacterium]